MKTQTYFCCTSDELENIIFSAFDQNYEIVPYEEFPNYHYEIEKVCKKDYTLFDEWDKGQFDSFLKGKPEHGSLSVIMAALCHCGHIEEGSYLIDCSW